MKDADYFFLSLVYQVQGNRDRWLTSSTSSGLRLPSCTWILLLMMKSIRNHRIYKEQYEITIFFPMK